MKRIKKEYYFIGILLLAFIILTILVVNKNTILVDKSVFNVLIYLKNNIFTNFMYVITQLASTKSIILILIVLLILSLVTKKFSDYKYILINVLSGVITMKVIKEIIKRPRPEWKWIVQDGYSYPSGHTISAFLLYGSLILLINKKVKNKGLKILLTIICTLMIILTGISRIYFGAHYLTDVIASILLGSIILIISNYFINKRYYNDKDKDRKTI